MNPTPKSHSTLHRKPSGDKEEKLEERESKLKDVFTECAVKCSLHFLSWMSVVYTSPICIHKTVCVFFVLVPDLKGNTPYRISLKSIFDDRFC